EAGDDALEFVLRLVLEALGRVLVAGEAVVVERQPHLAAGAQVPFAAGEPPRALVRFGHVGPDALDGAGEEALEPDGAGLDEGDGTGHLRFLLRVGVDEAFALAMASSARSAA